MKNQTTTPTLTVNPLYQQQKTEVIYQLGDNIIFHRMFNAFEYMHQHFDDKLLIQFCNCKGQEESGKLMLIDMPSGQTLFSVTPEFGRQKKFKWHHQQLFVVFPYGEFAINTEGKLVDRTAFLRAWVESGTIDIIPPLRELFEKVDQSYDALLWYQCELDSYIYSHQRHLHALSKISEALKLKGEICEFQLDYYRAFRSYTLANKINPNIAVQKNLERVAKRLSPDLMDSVNLALGLYANAMIRMNKDVRNIAYKKYSVK
ncbi:hypothetical protein HYE66_05800 [Aggregatibacter actinomycetemcomitans]|nr:hypothetical protein [Aggregatibacter actinomycetemcomitans]